MTTEATTAPAEAAQTAVEAATTTTDVVQAAAPAVVDHGTSIAELFNGIGTHVVYLMGFSFILGSLFTVLVLVVLDYMRRHKQ